ncbi:hypothetical protein PUNSTDRAFT_103483 [Punctularia strigosozonata HHB-11173 SS5]|uniref:uncharacterized protein n=1 Tax=Punctularia strigosozonata (strain HHB-11173) TaxID=741275 RepID=UPI0004417B5A|nr:uncharacterized protein PUNSTDRAFT_103483 [Punctularia strigosozonata HHB-11173 SS5]EIN08607.1 hypothetical protein PUNSTDRAFT_103483 [Punctularia strigosozonata HHB-11173 SS5]
MPCGHRFHPSCLRELVRKATEDESLFPPRCCDRRPGAAAIPYDAFGALLAPDEVRAYEDRKREFGTPAGERVYCSAPACGAFVGRKSAGEPPRAVPCVREGCGARTCDACGGAPHAWHVACSGGRDEGERALLALGREREWQRCPHCRRIVEKSGGCVHMMCWCGGEFCYRCGGGYHDGPCEEPVDVSVTRAALEAE